MRMASRLGPWSQLLGRPLGLGVCLLLVALQGGCLPKAKIQLFTATPPVACPGDEVTLHWQTNGSVRIEATPEDPTLGSQDDSGKQTVTIRGPTRFHLEASRFFGLKKQFTESEVLSPPKKLEYGVIDAEGQSHFECSTQTGALESSFELDANSLSSNVRMEQVTNANVRSLVISKGEVSETIAEGAKTSGFGGQSAQGLWKLRVPLEEGESCEDALESVDGRLILQFQLSCPR